MVIPILSLLTCLAAADAPAEVRGAITGVVVNASRDKSPVAECRVVLRARLENRFVVLNEISADHWGRFRFDNLPVGKYFEYLPGANRDGVHFSGPSVNITPEEPCAAVELSVCDSIAAPSPLVLRRHEICLHPEPGVLRVSEVLVIDNPSSACYVGQAPQEGAEPVTLALRISPEFERATFDEEYFGRRFVVSQGQLVTSLPWPPGKKELKFTYVIRNAETKRTWRRPLDLPCADVCVRVLTAKPEEVACNLSPAVIEKNEKGDAGAAVFQSAGTPLPSDFVISVDLRHLPVPWMAYARWTALFGLFGMVLGAGVFAIRRRRSPSRPTESQTAACEPAPEGRPSQHAGPHGPSRKHGKPRRSRGSA